MTEVRACVDAIDEELARLIGRRFRFMAAAAAIKVDRAAVRDEDRKAQVIGNACRHAVANDWPESVARQLWETLVEASIAYELARYDAR